MRRFLVILLALLLPINGWAAARPVEPCPMQMSKTAGFTAMNAGSMNMDCCEEHDTGKASNSCKPGYECQTGTLYFTTTPLATLEFSTSTQPFVRFTSQIANTAPAAVWRPPRL